MAKKKPTLLQSLYKKEYRRLQKSFYYWKKQGYQFPEEEFIKKNPKRVTKQAVEKLKALKPKDILKKAVQIDIETGEVLYEPKRKVSKPEIKIDITESIKPVEPAIDYDSYEPPEEYYPTLTTIDAIRNAIESLPDRNITKGQKLTQRKNSLLDILNDTVYSLDDEQLITYEHYLQEHQAEIFKNLEIIKYDSKDEHITSSFAQVARILNQGELTAMQAESISLMQESYGE